MSKTKIIATMGPASFDREVLTEMAKNGLSVCRLNLSHADNEYRKQVISLIHEVQADTNIPLAILFDTRGPEIRTRNFVDGKITVNTGDTLTISNGDFDGTAENFCITYPTLYQDVHSGSVILIDDGLIELEVIEVIGSDIKCLVKNGGVIKNRKGVNVPNVELNLPPITEEDEEDLIFGVKNDADYVAASFITKADDVHYIRKHLHKHGGTDIKIISKIENQQGVDNIDEIIEVSDGIMVARGDLGVETPAELIPRIQKMIIKKCLAKSTPVITATQMLESMFNNPRPTRAEVSDVANAVLDGTDAIMLSAESAAGKYPVEAVKTMERVSSATEESEEYLKKFKLELNNKSHSVDHAVSLAACSTAAILGAHAIICPTASGHTAKLVSSFRPKTQIVATTISEKVQRQMMLNWGVTPVLTTQEMSSDLLFYKSLQQAKDNNLVVKDDVAVITCGLPLAKAGVTNSIRVQVVE